MWHVSLHDTKDTLAYARAHSTTWAHATVQHLHELSGLGKTKYLPYV